LLLASAGTLGFVIFSEGMRILERQERPPLSRATLTRLIREWASLMFFLLTAPLSLLPSWPAPPLVEGPPQPPVLLVPGYALHRVGLIPLAAYLRRRQNRWVWAVNNPIWRDDIPAFSAALEEKVARMRQFSGAEQVDIIGHSMGGIVAAHLINGGGGSVRRLVTLGTPWRGTKMHVLGLGRQCHALAPTSPIIAAARPVAAPVTAIWSKTDAVVLPTQHATFEGAEAVELENQGHIAMMFSLTTMRAVESALSGGGEE
jgi:triacylglycerol lipase